MKPWAILMILVLLSLSSISCTKKSNRVVLPESHELRAGYWCEYDEEGKGLNCFRDPMRVMIDRGYLRDIMRELEACKVLRSAPLPESRFGLFSRQ